MHAMLKRISFQGRKINMSFRIKTQWTHECLICEGGRRGGILVS